MQRHPVIQQDMEQIASLELPWEEFAGKTVLITGASGFLPAYMVEFLLWLNEGRLASNPATVIGLVRNEGKGRQRFAPFMERPDFRLLVQDVCDPVEIGGELHYVIHAASQASPKYYGTDPVGTLCANVLGTQRLLELARVKKATRFMFFSSCEVYGAVPDGKPGETDYGYLDPLQVRSCYAESKRMGENMTACWHHQFGVPAVVVRPFHTYGPGMEVNDGRVFADFVADVVSRRDIVMKSDGLAIRAFCYLADAVAGFFTVLLKGRDGEAYNIGNDRAETSIIALAELLVSLFPERNLKVQKHESPAGNNYLQSTVSRIAPDISKATNLGWEPAHGLTEGFTKAIRSFDPWK